MVELTRDEASYQGVYLLRTVDDIGLKHHIVLVTRHVLVLFYDCTEEYPS